MDNRVPNVCSRENSNERRILMLPSFTTRRAALASGIAIATLTLAACSGGDTNTDTTRCTRS